jgi:hypothetical protein
VKNENVSFFTLLLKYLTSFPHHISDHSSTNGFSLIYPGLADLLFSSSPLLISYRL